MSIAQNPVMGKMAKSFANVNTYVHKGQNVISAKAFNRKDPNTEAQQSQRAAFKLIRELTNRFGGILQVGFPQRPEKQSAANMFMKLNLPAAIDFTGENPVIDYSKLTIAKGSLTDVNVMSASFANGKVTLTVDTKAAWHGVEATDQIQLIAGTTSGAMFAGINPRGSEAELSISLTVNVTEASEIAFVYLFVFSADKSKASNSVFVALA